MPCCPCLQNEYLNASEPPLPYIPNSPTILPIGFVKIPNEDGQQCRLFQPRWTKSIPRGTSKLVSRFLRDRQNTIGSKQQFIGIRANSDLTNSIQTVCERVVWQTTQRWAKKTSLNRCIRKYTGIENTITFHHLMNPLLPISTEWIPQCVGTTFAKISNWGEQ